MSISKGAFGQSAKGGFIESPMGARGWRGGGVAVLSGSGANDRYLAALNAKTGAKIWETALSATAGTAATGLCFNSAFQLYISRALSGGIERRSMADGSLEVSLSSTFTQSYRFPSAIGTDVRVDRGHTSLGIVAERYDADLTLPAKWQYDYPVGNRGSLGMVTDPSGTSYHTSNAAMTDNSTTEPRHWAISKDGALLWETVQENPIEAAGPSQHSANSVLDVDGTYMYVGYTDLTIPPPGDFTSIMHIYRFRKSDGLRIDDTTTAFSVGTAATAAARVLRYANSSLYIPCFRSAKRQVSVVRMSTSMTEIASIDLGVSATSVDILASDSVGSGDILVSGDTSTTWPGALGERANTWRISSDLSTIRWGVQVGTSAFNGIHGISSYKPTLA